MLIKQERAAGGIVPPAFGATANRGEQFQASSDHVAPPLVGPAYVHWVQGLCGNVGYQPNLSKNTDQEV